MLPYKIDVPQELVDDLRTYTSDKPEFNRLIEGTELSDDQLRLAVRLYLDRFNNSPPPLAYKYKLNDFPSYELLFEGVMIQCLTMAGIVSTRNFLNFNDAGVSFTINDKGQAYQGWLQMLMSQHAVKVQDIKVSLNAEEGFDYIPSPEDFYPYMH